MCVRSDETVVMVWQDDFSCFWCYCVIQLVKTVFALCLAVTFV